MKVLAFFLIALLLVGVPAFADVLTVDTEYSGWMSCTVSTVPCPSNDMSNNGTGVENYEAGYDATYNSGAELRNWFQFDLSSLAGTVVSAQIQIETGNYIAYQTTQETYQLTSLPSSFTFDNLGTGTYYASQVYTSADAGNAVTITLDAAAIAAIQADLGSTFDLGGRITTLQQTTPADYNESLFTHIGGDATDVQLIITTSDSGPVAPEPASWLLLFAALGALWFRRGIENRV